MGTSARLLRGSPIASSRGGRSRTVAPLRRTVQADLLIVAPFSLPAEPAAAVVGRLPGVVATERIEAVRMPVNGASTAVLGVDPSEFRSFAARPTGAVNALWQGVADGGIAVSYTMGTDWTRSRSAARSSRPGGRRSKLPRGGVRHARHRRGQRRGVRRDRPRRSARRPATRSWSACAPSDFTADAAAIGRLIPKGAGVEQLVSLVSIGTDGPGRGTARRARPTESAVPQAALDAMLKAAMSRRGLPYVWGAAGPTSFDCSGLVQWSFAQAGIVMPRVAADQALYRPGRAREPARSRATCSSTTPTRPRPTYISHVAIYLGNGWMIQAPSRAWTSRWSRPTSAASSPARSGSAPPQAAAVAAGIA